MASLTSWTHPRWSRLAAGTALALAVAAAAAGCTSSPATTTNTSKNTSAPALTTAQARGIFNAYAATTAEAARTQDSALALSVVTGVQRGILAATLKFGTSLCSAPPSGGSAFSGSGCFSGEPAYYRYAYGAPDIYLPEQAGYPRFFLADAMLTLKGAALGKGMTTWTGPAGVTVPIDGRALMVFEQASASAAWQLASVSRFPSGMALPRLAMDANGYVPQVPLTATALLARPDVTGPLQAAVVDDGPASSAAKAVAAGPLTTGMYQAARTHVEGLTAPRGDVYQWELEGTRFPAFALRTASGGALVLYAMYLNSTVAVPDVINKANHVRPGLPIAVPPIFLPMVPTDKIAPRESLETQELLSFAGIDPPAAAAGTAGSARVTVIAIGGGPNYATAS